MPTLGNCLHAAPWLGRLEQVPACARPSLGHYVSASNRCRGRARPHSPATPQIMDKPFGRILGTAELAGDPGPQEAALLEMITDEGSEVLD